MLIKLINASVMDKLLWQYCTEKLSVQYCHNNLSITDALINFINKRLEISYVWGNKELSDYIWFEFYTFYISLSNYIKIIMIYESHCKFKPVSEVSSYQL